MNSQVVPDTSSTLGDPREHAETLVGNHMDICRISGPEDPNFDPVVGELRRLYKSIAEVKAVPDITTDAPYAVTSSRALEEVEDLLIARELGALTSAIRLILWQTTY